MENIGFTLAGDGTLHIHMNGVSKAVRPDAAGYASVLAAVREKNWDFVANLLNPLKDIEALDDRFEVVHGVVVITHDDGETFDVPSVLGDEIMRYADMGLPVDRLIKFAKNLDENPSRSAVQGLYGWIKQTNLTLTEDGHFIAYKGLRSDWTDHKTGTFDNSPGETVKMKRNQCDEDADNPCSQGLHVATYDYAHRHYGGGSKHVVAVKVNPKDVVAVPNTENQKMRCCKYLVLEESFAEMGSPTYPAPVDVGDSNHEEDTCYGCGMFESDCYCDSCPECGNEYCSCDED